MSAAIVRSAEHRDLEACVELALAASGESVSGAEAWRRGLATDLDDPDRLLLVAELDARVVGYGRVRTFEPEEGAPPETCPAGYYLLGLYVRPDSRRRGIGLELTDERLDWITERADEAWFFSNAQNTASIALHRSLGFGEVTRRFRFPGATFDGGEGILFRAALAERR